MHLAHTAETRSIPSFDPQSESTSTAHGIELEVGAGASYLVPASTVERAAAHSPIAAMMRTATLALLAVLVLPACDSGSDSEFSELEGSWESIDSANYDFVQIEDETIRLYRGSQTCVSQFDGTATLQVGNDGAVFYRDNLTLATAVAFSFGAA